MKPRIICLLALLATLPATSLAKEYEWTVGWTPPDFGIFPSPQAACSAFYSYILATYGGAGLVVTPYVSPYPRADPRPGADPEATSAFSCDFSITANGAPFPPVGHIYILRDGDGCKEGVPFNPATGKCERPDEDQERKEDGVAANHAVAGAVICGNPINIGAGNKYQEEEDFADPNGELRFKRHYNSRSGIWRHSYQASLLIRKEGLVLTFDDGYSVLFSRKDGRLIPDADDAGSLMQVGDEWIYSTAANETFVFDRTGALTSIRQASGLHQKLSRKVETNGDMTTTVTDSRGHSLVFLESATGRLLSATTSSVQLAYGYDTSERLNSVARRWPGHETSKRFVYEDTAHPSKVTGLIDERGVRYATWAYDAEGRATSSEHAGGTEKISLNYGADGSVALTNALGHVTTFRYEVVQGMKRVAAVEGEPTLGCPASNSTYTYTPAGQVKTHTDGLGYVTVYEYDELGREIKRTRGSGTPQARVTATTWDGSSRRPATVTTPGRVTAYSYDSEGRQININVTDAKE
jgi:YD repeat-containing protein